ncbi:39S ribosomal protein L9, mitochondrial [Heterodontus francisci]|uniref:39S ribosomal protein L9, mitochondrial n=1 Tax=Heterodontus francisci TaxID=7792 RepID=UPI00355B0F9D
MAETPAYNDSWGRSLNQTQFDTKPQEESKAQQAARQTALGSGSFPVAEVTGPSWRQAAEGAFPGSGMWRSGGGLKLLLRLRGGGSGRGLGPGSGEAAGRGLGLSAALRTVIVERWWQVPLPKEGKPARLHPRRHRIYKLVEDTKQRPKENLEVILTQTVSKHGGRGDVVFVKKSIGRNQLLPRGLAVYASPENRAMFEEERRLLREGKPEERMQTRTGEMTIEFLKNSKLTVRMKNNVKWQLTKEIVCRHFLKELQVFVPPDALKIPDESITTWGEHWCEVTVNGIDKVRMPMSVVNFELPKTRRYKEWLLRQQQQQQNEAEEEGAGGMPAKET